MYSKYIPHNPSNIFWNIQEILIIGQILAQPSTIEQNAWAIALAKCSILGKLFGIFWNSQESFLGVNQKCFKTFVQSTS